jgi:pimeloyl-ACP methyl ester carboxylesterase
MLQGFQPQVAEAFARMFEPPADAPDRVGALSRITVLALVMHGTADPAVPLPHGEATAKAIPGATLLTIEGLGHEYPRVVHGQIVSAILERTAGAQELVGN